MLRVVHTFKLRGFISELAFAAFVLFSIAPVSNLA